MKKLKWFPLLFTAASLLFCEVSCKKEDEDKEDDKTEEQTSASSPTPTFTSGSGALVAIRSRSTVQSVMGPVYTDIGLAVAVFYTNGNTGTFVDAGTVKVNTKALSQQSNKSYVFTPGLTDVTGISFDENVEWNVSGASGVSAFSYTTSIGFPNITEITSAETVAKSSGYTLSASGVSGADSIIFQIGNVTKTKAGNTTSCTFSASELSGVASGTSIAQVAAYKVEEKIHNTKTYYYVNETVVTKTVTVQ